MAHAKAVLKSAVRRTGLRHSHLAAARMCVERNVRARKPGTPFDLSPRILCYHSVGTPEWGVNDVSPARFAAHLEVALVAGRRFVPASTIAAGHGKPGDLALTFDDGLRTVISGAAPVLRDLGIPWTLFVVTDWADGVGSFEPYTLRWNEIEEAARLGATIASHSVTHPNFARLPDSRVDDEVFRSRDTLESRIGVSTNEFAIPLGLAGDWTDHAQQAAHAAGYEHVYSQSADRRFPGTVARTFIGRFDDERIFGAALNGVFDRWDESR